MEQILSKKDDGAEHLLDIPFTKPRAHRETADQLVSAVMADVSREIQLHGNAGIPPLCHEKEGDHLNHENCRC
jgi:hypothetical protein